MFEVIVETKGSIPNQEVHVAKPLALIIAQSFEFALVTPRDRVLPSDVAVHFEENIHLEEDVLVAITVKTGYDPEDVGDTGDVERLHEAIASSIRHSGMFNCRTTKGPVRLELSFGIAKLKAVEIA